MSPRHECENCAYWSQLIAKAEGTIPVVKALCESPQPGLMAGKYTSARQSCSDWSAVLDHHDLDDEKDITA